jgi:hypothetical protein
MAVGNEHTPPQNQQWTNTRVASEHLRVGLVGMHHELGAGYSNRDGIGARITVYEAGHLGDPAHRILAQQVESKGGFSAQNAMEPTFGTPGRTTVDVRIRWPGSGGQSIVQALRSVATSQRIVVVERRPGDATGDGVVDVDDLIDVLTAWGPCSGTPCVPDLDGNGTVDIDDVMLVLMNWST